MAHDVLSRQTKSRLSENRKVTMPTMLAYLLDTHGLKRDRRTVYRWIRDKKFPTAMKVGHEWFFWTAEVDLYLERNPP